MGYVLRKIWNHLERKRKWQLLLLLILMIFTAVTEVISIGAVIPFLTVLTAPQTIFNNEFLRSFASALRLSSSSELLLPITIAFGFSAIFSACVRLLLLWTTTRLSFLIGVDLSMDIYRKALYQPYLVQISRNSSEVIDGILSKVHMLIYGVILPILNIVIGILMLLSILGVLFVIQPLVAFVIFAGFGLVYLISIYAVKSKLLENSVLISRESTKVLRALQEGLGGIREVLIDGTQEIHCKGYRTSEMALRNALGNNQFIASSPKYIIEALGIILISFMAYLMTRESGSMSSGAVPILGAFALGAQRVLPTMQQIYSSWVNVKSSIPSARDAISLLEASIPKFQFNTTGNLIEFRGEIRLSNIAFRYNPAAPLILNGIDLRIGRGEKVGFIGTSGCGKSTLLDIILGLLEPVSGDIYVDDTKITLSNSRGWQKKIAHVPQSIYLIDGTISQNIAFGVPVEEIDFKRVRLAAMRAQIFEIIESWDDGFETLVGERGVKLSGGQRQRIGIARALYRDAQVLVLDEATSALDANTELLVMNSLSSGMLSEKLTMIIVAHRLETLLNCDKVFEICDGKIVRTFSYQELIAAIKTK